MDDITHGNTPESPESRPEDEHPGSYLTPWNEPPVATPPVTASPEHQASEAESRGHVSTGVVAFVSAVVGAIAVVGILAALGLFSTDTTEAIATPVEEATSPVTTVVQQVVNEIITNGGDSNVAEAVAIKVVPSVVTVEVGNLEDNVLTLNGSGSGVIMDDGYIVTNHHVIEDATVTRIVLQDGRIYDTEVVGSDAYSDLAVLKIDIEGLRPIEFGSTEDVIIGQYAVAVGNPLGQEGGASLTTGVISALSRTVEVGDESPLYGMLQTDAPITSGSSGGALVDSEGSLIGITSAIGVGRGGAEGIGYAIPVELVQRITDEIIETGTVLHGFIGIYGTDYVETADDGALVPGGAEIAELWDGEGGSAAGRSGFEAGDVIVSVEGTEITSMEDLVIELRLHHVGDEIEMTVMRDSEPFTASLVLDERPEDPAPIVEEDLDEDLEAEPDDG
ncbi:MAG: trypsin-like peptidase domain-containing protein [Actinomycetota bacterium]|nr:trypsin-like peptidase domain-containing protein [Actinomycetota bacterium]